MEGAQPELQISLQLESSLNGEMFFTVALTVVGNGDEAAVVSTASAVIIGALELSNVIVQPLLNE